MPARMASSPSNPQGWDWWRLPPLGGPFTTVSQRLPWTTTSPRPTPTRRVSSRPRWMPLLRSWATCTSLPTLIWSCTAFLPGRGTGSPTPLSTTNSPFTTTSGAPPSRRSSTRSATTWAWATAGSTSGSLAAPTKTKMAMAKRQKSSNTRDTPTPPASWASPTPGTTSRSVSMPPRASSCSGMPISPRPSIRWGAPTTRHATSLSSTASPTTGATTRPWWCCDSNNSRKNPITTSGTTASTGSTATPWKTPTGSPSSARRSGDPPNMVTRPRWRPWTWGNPTPCTISTARREGTSRSPF
mmetsp:Transcript_29201/g.68629  ORF Transcript_29201/g.68629 Transcript_29201/m.68629 type:complete len:299 (+) Transcript_29201:467-1363(+)